MTGQDAQEAWEAAHRRAYARTAWRRALPAAGALTYRALGRSPEDPEQRDAAQEDPAAVRQWTAKVALPTGLLVALAIWQAARIADVLVDDVPLADAQRVLRTKRSLFAEPLPDAPAGTWADLREGGLDVQARADTVLAHHIAADAREFTRDPERPAPLQVGDAVRAVRSGPYRDGGPPRWRQAVDNARAAIARASTALYTNPRPPGELDLARARTGRLWIPDQDEIDAAAAIHPTLTAEPDTPAVPGSDGTVWIQRLLRLAHVDATLTAVVQHHLDRADPAFRPGRPLPSALGATGAALTDLAKAARDLERTWADTSPTLGTTAWERRHVPEALRRHITALERVLRDLTGLADALRDATAHPGTR
ncbi:hypothetical protein [Kitasatospora phosalacinea]|uniref:hypothetical protein n=1 Tax=Kitasatospora phosalacinea TaxID=2065 RepID=UPI00052480F8|nr:hypothetical protein [Kitasatospora phosalacinea]